MLSARPPLLLCSLLILGSMALFAPVARAQSTPDANQERAKELYQNGSLLYDEGRYEDAIVAFQEAYRLSEQPKLLYNIAQAQERLGRYQDALDTLSRYRAYAPAEEREALDRRIRNLERRLEEAGSAPTPTPAPTATAPSSAPAPTPTPTPERDGVRVLPIALYAVGGVGLGAGALFGLSARSARADAEALCVDGATGALCPDSAADPLSRDRRSSLLADVGFGVGAAGLIGGTLTLILGGDAAVSGTGAGLPSALSLGVRPGGASLTLSGSF